MAIQIISSDGSIITEEIGSCQWDLTIQVDTENNLVYGGVVTWLQDYDFYISPAGYYLNDTFYESPEAFITLNPADPTLDRFDVIYVDSDQVVKVLEGTPSITASQPGLDLGTQLGLGVIFVQAATTQPGTANEECGYIDNTEWTASASDSSIDVGSANTPCSGSVSIEGTTVTTGDYFKLTRGTAFALSPDFNNVHFVIRSKGAWGNRKLNIRWYNAGLPVGNPIAFGHGNTYNFASNNTVDCQLITLDAADFGLPISQQVDEIRFTMSGNNDIGFFIDNVCIQNNGSIVLPADNDIHNQYFGPQTPGDFWILGNGRADGWFTSPTIVGGVWQGGEKFGWGSSTAGTGNTAIGMLAQANGQEGATALGCQSVANVGVAIGLGALSTRGVAIGGYSDASGGTVVGWGATNTALSGIAIGGNAQTLNYFSSGAIALGYFARVDSAYGGIAIGPGAYVSPGASFSTAIGIEATATAPYQFIIGGDTLYTDTGYQSLYFGSGVTSPFLANRFWTISGSEGTDVGGTVWTFAGAKGTGSGNSGTFEWQTSVPTTTGTTLQSLATRMGLNSNTLGFYMADTRFQMDEGTDIVAAGDLTLTDGNTFTVTGSTTINAITSTNWQDGALIYLVFTGIPTLKHDTIGGAGTSRLRLAGAIDFDVTANTVLALVLKDGYWREVGRTQAIGGGSGILSADNGLTLTTPTNVQLGGILLHDTIIDATSAYSLIVNGSGGGIPFKVNSANNITSQFISQTSIAVQATGGDNFPSGHFTNSTPYVSSIIDAMHIQHEANGSPAALGIGVGLSMNVSDDTGLYQATRLTSKWTDLTHATRTSQFAISGANNGTVSELFTLKGTGQIQGNKYGVGTFIAAPVYSLGVDISGNIVEFVGGGGGGALSANNGLTENVADNVQLGGTLLQQTTIDQGIFDLIFDYNSTYGLRISSGLQFIGYGTGGVAGTPTYGLAVDSTGNVVEVALGGSITADNGLTMSTATNAQLGGTLIQTTTVNTGGFQTNWTGSNSGVAILNLFNSGSGPGIVSATTGGGTSGYFTALGGTAVVGEQGLFGGIFSGSTVGVAAGGTTDTAIPLSVTHTLTTTNTAERMISISRGSSGTSAIGIGSYIEYDLESDGGTAHAGRIGYVLTDVTSSFEDSRFDLTTISGGVVSRKLAIHDNGQMTLDEYGVGNFPDTPAYALGVDGSGNVIEFTPSVGGGGFLTADNGLTASSATNVQLGGTLIQDTTILSNGFKLIISDNAAAGESIFRVESTSTAAASNSQKGIEVSLTGANATASQITYGIHSVNSHTGTNSWNYGGVFEANSGTLVNIGVYSIGTTIGVHGIVQTDTGGYGVFGQNTSSTPGTNFGVYGEASGAATTNIAGNFVATNATNNYAIIVPHASGKVGIGLNNPTATRLHVVDTGVGAAAIAEISTTSTAAAGNSQKALNISLSGVNANSNQTTYGIYISNVHTGTGATNVGAYSTVTNGIAFWGLSAGSTAVYGQTDTDNGVYGAATGAGVGVKANSESYYGLQVQSQSYVAGILQSNYASTNTVETLLEVKRLTSGGGGAGADGIGGSINLHTSTTTTGGTLSNQLISKWVDATHASRTSQLDITGVGSAATTTIMSAYGTGVVGIGISSSYGATRLDVLNAATTNVPTLRVQGNPSGGATVQITNTSAGSYGMHIFSTASSSIGAEIQGDTTGVIGRGLHASLGTGVLGTGTLYGGTFTSSLTSNGVHKALSVNTAPTTGANGDGIDIDFGMRSTNNTTLNTGIIRNKTTTMGTATSTGEFNFLLSDGSGLTANAQVLTLSGNGSMTLTPMTATAASAITPAEGMIVIVNTTNGTFTSVGFWGYSGGAWAKF